MSEWPGATSNQVLQSLVATATAGPTGQPLISPGGLGRTDPGQYPDRTALGTSPRYHTPHNE